MQKRGPGCRARWLAGAFCALALIVTSAGDTPPDADDPAPDREPPADCPGKLHHPSQFDAPAADPHEPRTPFWVVVPPYGIVRGVFPPPPPARGSTAAPRAGYRAQVFRITDCPQAPVGDRFVGLDHLVTLMGHEGLKFYRSSTVSMESGPEGIIAVNDVVVIKINYQWSERGGTNTDVLSGLIRRIVDHPDTFTGEIVVCENAQFASVQNFNRSSNNAENISLSPADVVDHFQGQGYKVSHFDWTAVRYNQVLEYSAGNMIDGYVVYPYNPALSGRVSYPKFQSSQGTYISLKYGVWNPLGGTYDRQRLKFINVPVLKSHHSTYGVTACVKDYMGVVTGVLSTNSHSAIQYGILGALLGEIQLADLNILDAIWINANPYTGPATSYGGATRRDELVASVDPVAADIWATKIILIPAFMANGYYPPWPEPSADPDDATSDFRVYLDNSMGFILTAGYDATNDLRYIDSVTWSGAGDLDGDGFNDTVDNCPYDANPGQADCDDDGTGDLCAIREGLSQDCNANGIPDECEWPTDVNADGVVNVLDLIELLLCFGQPADPPCDASDINTDGTVNVLDLIELLLDFGSTCPP
ncbi:MAG: DUF362 domain-containing protein [Planctomycetota bacterium]|jgi:hypothetical protein